MQSTKRCGNLKWGCNFNHFLVNAKGKQDCDGLIFKNLFIFEATSILLIIKGRLLHKEKKQLV